MPAVALVAACGGEPRSNYQAAQAETQKAQKPAECFDCGEPMYGPDGKIIPQG